MAVDRGLLPHLADVDEVCYLGLRRGRDGSKIDLIATCLSYPPPGFLNGNRAEDQRHTEATEIRKHILDGAISPGPFQAALAIGRPGRWQAILGPDSPGAPKRAPTYPCAPRALQSCLPSTAGPAAQGTSQNFASSTPFG